MSSATIATLVKMIESLPNLQDEVRWDELLQRTQPGLVEAARKARAEMAAGQAEPLDTDRL